MYNEDIINKVLKDDVMFKSAKMFDVDDHVVCIDQVQGLNKGTIYRVTKNSTPGMISIAVINIDELERTEPDDFTGEEIGEFRADHFVKSNNEY